MVRAVSGRRKGLMVITGGGGAVTELALSEDRPPV